MNGLGLRAAIIIAGAGVVMTVPTLMVMRSKPTASIASATTYPAQSPGDDADLQARRATRIALAHATPTATSTPAASAAAFQPMSTPPTAATTAAAIGSRHQCMWRDRATRRGCA